MQPLAPRPLSRLLLTLCLLAAAGSSGCAMHAGALEPREAPFQLCSGPRRLVRGIEMRPTELRTGMARGSSHCHRCHR